MTEYHLPDWAMCVGVESYPWPSDFYQEALKMGVSKALPTALPYEPGQTRLVCLHPKACVAVTAPDMNLYDLAIELATEHLNGEFDNVIPLLIDAETGYNTLAMIESLQIAEKAGDLPRLESKYGLKWGLGFFMYVYITGLQYVAREGETELPTEWRDKGVEIVRVEYTDGSSEDGNVQ